MFLKRLLPLIAIMFVASQLLAAAPATKPATKPAVKKPVAKKPAAKPAPKKSAPKPAPKKVAPKPPSPANTIWTPSDQKGMVPFHIPEVSNPKSLIKLNYEPIKPDSPRIVVTDGKFVVGGKRVKIFGYNIGGTINVTHKDADKLADRLADAGINSIRFHGLEFREWMWDGRKLNKAQKAQQDQFDYLLHVLAERGIYTNLNLHVSRDYTKEVKVPGSGPWFGSKVCDILEPKIIERQKKFASNLLKHVNPYRKLSYADDPAIAFVEINNENSLFIWDWNTCIPKLPAHYKGLVKKYFNAYLKKKYGTTAKLREKWAAHLGEAESIEKGTVQAVIGPDITKYPKVRSVDLLLCLLEVEESYWNGIYKHCKEEAGYKGLVTGSIIFGPLSLYSQRNMDWIDCHAYWGHPRWDKGVNRWNRAKWTLPSLSMADSPNETVTDLDPISGIMFFQAAQQLKGKPFTVSEYNHCAPNDYQAECVPVMASFGAMQDWDGMWFFLVQRLSQKHKTIDWFDMDVNPSKWGFTQAGSVIFRDSGITPAAQVKEMSYCGTTQPLVDLARGQIKRNYDLYKILEDRQGVSWKDFLNVRMEVNLDGVNKPVAGDASAGRSKMIWDLDNGQGRYIVKGPSAMVWMGRAARLDGSENFKLESPRFAVVTMNTMDGKEFKDSKKILVTAVFRCENTAAVFNEWRDSVGTKWGKAPILIEPITGTISGLDFLKKRKVFFSVVKDWKCQALNSAGEAIAEVPLKTADDGTYTLQLDGKYKTMWYLLTAK